MTSVRLSEDRQVKATRRRAVRKRKPAVEEEERVGASEREEAGAEVEIDRQLDQSLETKSKQHNLTTVNVRNIIHVSSSNQNALFYLFILMLKTRTYI